MLFSLSWFFIRLWSLAGFLLVLQMYFWKEGGIQTFFSEHFLLGSFILLLWIFLNFIRNHKDIYLQKLKTILLVLEIYLLLLVFLETSLPFSQREFLVFYLVSVGLVYEIFHPRYEKWKKISVPLFYSIILCFLGSVALFIPYRQAFDKTTFKAQEPYLLYRFFSKDFSPYHHILLYQWDSSLPLSLWKDTTLLEKGYDYRLLFSAQERNEESFLLLESPLGEYLQIFPQSQVNFSTKTSSLFLEQKQGKVSYFSPKDSLPESLLQLRKNAIKKEKEAALGLLPVWIKSNPKFQERSFSYTQFVAKIFPFWYQKNAEIAQSFSPYFDFISFSSKKPPFSSTEDTLTNSLNFWRKKSLGIQKYWEYLKDFF